MSPEDFRKTAHQLVDWMADYLETVEHKPVKSAVSPGDIRQKIPNQPPLKGEAFQDIFSDFESIIMPGITHWQHPKFFAYFPANSSYASLLGEMTMATLAAQCMIWDTSPAAAELEESVLNWLRDMLQLPSYFEGVIQDTASTATLCSLICAREKASSNSINQDGFSHNRFRVYCSEETHSSIEKGAKIAGFGKKNLVKTPVRQDLSLDPIALGQLIEDDLKNNFIPTAVIGTIGTTGTTAVDPIAEIGQICRTYGIWFHIDAAYAGTALILPEFADLREGIEFADSFVFNPHKWMLTHFDCSAYFVKDAEKLKRAFEILPEYLKTNTRGKVNDYRDWGIQLGRRFRALKLWFVIRNVGVEGIQAMIRSHIQLTKTFQEWVEADSDYEVAFKGRFNLFGFRHKPLPGEDERKHNLRLMNAINKSGRLYLTHTNVHGRIALRICVGQASVTRRHIEEAWEDIKAVGTALRHLDEYSTAINDEGSSC